MAQNVEIKARIDSSEFELIRQRAAAIATGGPILLNQTDTFFKATNGRLKLREFDNGSAELIAYERPDCKGPKTSTYVRAACDGETMLLALSRSLGVVGVVKKSREVYLVDQTRIHLDQVDGLGTFLELEVVLKIPKEQESSNPADEPSLEQGVKIAQTILDKLNVAESNLISGAYLDLLQNLQV